MFSFLKREKWAHLKTSTITGVHFAAGSLHEKKDGVVYIHFYESDKGNRKIEMACSFSEVGQEKINDFVKSSGLYQRRITRWLNGRFDPEIPRYSQIGEEDTVHALKGTIE